MRLLPVALLTLLGLPLSAEEFEFRGVPVESNVVMSFQNTQDLELSKLPAMQRLRERMLNDGKNSAKKKNIEKTLREELGINLEKDFRSLALGLAAGKAPAVPGANPDFRVAAVVRGTFDAAKFQAFAEKRKITVVTSGARTGWRASEFASAVTGEAPPRDTDSVLFVYDASTLVVTKLKDAEACFASLEGKSPSYVLPAIAKTVIPATGKVYGLVFVDTALMPPSPDLEKSGFRNGVLMLSEQGTQQVYKLSVGFADAEKSKQSSTQLQGILAMAPLFAMATPKDTPEVARLKKVAVKILGGFEPTKVEGERVTVGLKVENIDMVELIECLYDLSQTQPAKSEPAAPPTTK